MKFWLYHFLKVFLYIPFRMFAKHVFIDGLEHLPKDKPILIASNHPNSFLDGVVIEYFLRRNVFTMVRGDMFRKPSANMALRSMRLLPIFRARDAKAEEARAGNNSSFEECYSLFRANQIILIFSEGDSYPEKNVRKLKNGTAQMAADMMLRGGIDLHIVPCGINYSRFFKWRTDIQFSFGNAISLKSSLNEIEEDKRKFVVGLTEKIQNEIERLVVKTTGDNEQVKNQIQEWGNNQHTDPNFFKIKNSHAGKTVSLVDHTDLDLAKSYIKLLETNKVNDRAVSRMGLNYTAIFTALVTTVVSLPLSIIVFGIWKFAQSFAKKKVKNKLFYDSIFYGIGTAGHLILTLIIIMVSFSIYPAHWALIIITASIVGPIAWLRSWEEIKQIPIEFRFLALSKSAKTGLEAMRESILSEK